MADRRSLIPTITREIKNQSTGNLHRYMISYSRNYILTRKNDQRERSKAMIYLFHRTYQPLASSPMSSQLSVHTISRLPLELGISSLSHRLLSELLDSSAWCGRSGINAMRWCWNEVIILRHACVARSWCQFVAGVVGCCCCRSLVDGDFFERSELCGVSVLPGFVLPAIGIWIKRMFLRISRDILACSCGIG